MVNGLTRLLCFFVAGCGRTAGDLIEGLLIEGLLSGVSAARPTSGSVPPLTTLGSRMLQDDTKGYN